MGVPVSYPDKLGFVKNINNYIQSTNRPNIVSGKYLNWLFNAVAYLIGTALNNAGGTWKARISQSGGGAPELSIDSMGGAGHVIMNTIEYNGALVNISFEWLAPGTYKCIADQPIFAEFNDFSVVWANNFVLDVGGIAQYGEIYITHNPASPNEFIFYTFDGINGGLPQDNFLLNCTLEINRPC